MKQNYWKIIRSWIIAVLIFNYALQSSLARNPQPSFGSTSEGFRLGLNLVATNFARNGPIGMSLIVTNVCDRSLWFLQSDLRDYQFKLIDARGEPVSANSKKVWSGGIIEVSDSGPAPVKVELPAAKQSGFESDLRFVFRLDQPGTYKLTAIRLVPQFQSSTNVASGVRFTNLISNQVEFSIR